METGHSTKNILFKYERSKILAERVQQLYDGADSYVDYDDTMSIYDIANKELMNDKLPFLLKRDFNNKEELWKLNKLLK